MSNITSDAAPSTAQPRPSQRWRWIAIVVGGIALVTLLSILTMRMSMDSAATDLDYSTTLVSEQGLYEVSYASDLGSVPINQIQSWTLHVETSDGQPVENATISVDGDMPEHAHGLPTEPQVTGYLGNGDYQVEGLRFHMPGWWVVDFEITANGQTDKVRFNLMLR